MSSPSLARLALNAAAILTLSSGCATRFVRPTPELQVKPLECVKTCPQIPEPTGPSEAEMMRWEHQMVQWGERCALVSQDCAAAYREARQ